MHRGQAGRGGESGGQEDVAAKLGQRPAVYYRSQLVARTNYFVFLRAGHAAPRSNLQPHAAVPDEPDRGSGQPSHLRGQAGVRGRGGAGPRARSEGRGQQPGLGGAVSGPRAREVRGVCGHGGPGAGGQGG